MTTQEREDLRLIAEDIRRQQDALPKPSDPEPITDILPRMLEEITGRVKGAVA